MTYREVRTGIGPRVAPPRCRADARGCGTGRGRRSWRPVQEPRSSCFSLSMRVFRNDRSGIGGKFRCKQGSWRRRFGTIVPKPGFPPTGPACFPSLIVAHEVRRGRVEKGVEGAVWGLFCCRWKNLYKCVMAKRNYGPGEVAGRKVFPTTGLTVGVPQSPNTNSRLILHEENWLPLIRSLDTLSAVADAVGV